MKRKHRQRHVFGRRRIQLNGITYLLFMHKDRLAVRELYARREYVLSLTELVDAALGQRTMRLQPK